MLYAVIKISARFSIIRRPTMKPISALSFGITLSILTSLGQVANFDCSERAAAHARTKQIAQPTVQDDAGCPGCITSATTLFAQGHNKEAAELLRSWIVKCPNNLQLHLLFNTILMRLPDSKEEALTVARKATQIAPDSMLAHFQTAITLLMMNNSKGAQVEFEQVVALDPANHEAWLSLSDLYATLNEPEKAKEATRKATALNPSAQTARLRTIISLNSSGNQNGVAAQFKQFLGDSDMSAENFIALGDEALNMGYFEQANQCFNRVLESYPRSSNARFKSALSSYYAGDIQGALDAIKADKSIDLLKSDMAAQAHALNGLCLLQLGEQEKGQQEIAAAAEKKPGDLSILARGLLAYKNGDYKQALSQFNSALSKNKNLHEARILSGQTMLKSGETLDALSQAIELRKTAGLLARAIALELSSRLKQEDLEAKNIGSLKSEASRMLATMPEDALHKAGKGALNLALARAALAEKNSDEAQTKVAQAEACGVTDEEIALLKARIAAFAGDDRKQTEELDKALVQAPGDIEALSLLGMIYSKNNDVRGEALLLKAAGQGEPGPQAIFELAKVMEKKGNIEEAVKLFKRSLENGLRGPDKMVAQDAVSKRK
jgi:tetratricopeptide (TPR) repeat protein